MYATEFKPQSRETFSSRIGADPTRPLIAFFLGSAPWHRTQEKVVEAILVAIRDGRIQGRPQLLIRFGPSEKPNSEFESLGREYKDDLIMNTHANMSHYEDMPNIIVYSTVTLSHFSSTALDAAVLDRPAAYIGFSGFSAPHPSDAVMARIFEFDFVKQALETGGVQVAWNAEELTSFINKSVQNPGEDRDKRKKFIERFLGSLDGKAGERIAQIISTHALIQSEYAQ